MEGTRPLPLPDDETRFFWDGCREHKLMILRCEDCGTYIHLPKPACRTCGGSNLSPSQVSGRGVVHTYTVVHNPLPGFTPPFGVVLVELEEQKGLRLVTNLVDVAPDQIEIGTPVEVVFEKQDDEITIPLFRRRSAGR
jgi:uncharacterized OB-fold protein